MPPAASDAQRGDAGHHRREPAENPTMQAIRDKFAIAKTGPVLVALSNWRRKNSFTPGELVLTPERGGTVTVYGDLSRRKLIKHGKLVAADAFAEPPDVKCAICMVLQLHETGDQDTVTIVLSQSEQQAWLRVLNAAIYVDHICVMAIKPVAVSMTAALGKGSFGEVLQGSFRGGDVAIKVISGGADDLNSLVEVASEAGVLKSVQQHDNVLEFIGVALFDANTAPPLLRDVVAAASLAEGAGVLGLVVELCPFGTLKELIHELDRAGRIIGPGPDLGLTQLSQIACGIAEGCRFVHGLGVVHRDLKPENIMMSAGYVPKLVDFGQSRFVALNREMTADVRGSLLWRAPEIMSGGQGQQVAQVTLYGVEADVYSFAIIFWEMLTGEEPYKSVRNTWDIVRGVQAGTLRPTCCADWPPRVKSLIEWCWTGEVEARPSAEEVTMWLRDPAFTTLSPDPSPVPCASPTALMRGLSSQSQSQSQSQSMVRPGSALLDGIDGRSDPSRGSALYLDLPALVVCLRRGVEQGGLRLVDRRWLGLTFPDVFEGRDLCNWLQQVCGCTPVEAAGVGVMLQTKGFISHSVSGTKFSLRCFWYWRPDSVVWRLLLLLEAEHSVAASAASLTADAKATEGDVCATGDPGETVNPLQDVITKGALAFSAP